MVKTSLDWRRSMLDTNGARASPTLGAQEPSSAKALRCLQQHMEAWQASVTPGVQAAIAGVVFFARPQALWAALRARLVLLSCLLSE
jgi:hypothetical protein